MTNKGSNRVATKRERTKYAGVYERKYDVRMNSGKADVCFDITYKRDGRKIWEKVGWSSEGYTANLASQFRANRIMGMRHGDELPKDKQKAPYFKDVAAKYLEWSRENKARNGSDDEYRYRLYLSKVFDGKRLNEVTSFDLERFKAQLFQYNLSPSSVRLCLVLFRQIFNKSVAWRMHKGENPIKGVKLPILQNQRERFLKYEEADTLLTELKNVSGQLHDMALISLHCGLRAGELFNLKTQDLDFQNGLINVADAKNKESRKAFMTETVKELLLNRKLEAANEYVFKDMKHAGKIKSVSAAFARAVKRLGLNKGITDRRQMVTFHTLRHTFASWLALQGETILTIKELLGHKSLVMTTRYAHLMPEHKKQATLNLEKNFLKKRNGTTAKKDVNN